MSHYDHLVFSILLCCDALLTQKIFQAPPILENKPNRNCGNYGPYCFREAEGSLTSTANKQTKDAGDGTYDLSSLSEKTRMRVSGVSRYP